MGTPNSAVVAGSIITVATIAEALASTQPNQHVGQLNADFGPVILTDVTRTAGQGSTHTYRAAQIIVADQPAHDALNALGAPITWTT